MSKLDNVRIFNSPITNESYLCSVNSKNIITDKLKLDEDKMMEFIFGIVKTLEKSYGSDIKLEDGAHFIVDLIGLEVFTEDGELLGNLVEVLQPGANDVYIVENSAKQQILLPAIPDVIKQIDIANKKMIVKLLEGLR